MSELKNVLFVSYYFPPSGGPGVQRMLKFAKYLPEYGYRPFVLTVPEDSEFPARDETLLAECPPPGQVFRSSTVEFYRLYKKLTGKSQGGVDITASKKSGLRERLSRWVRGAVFIPDGRVGWVWSGTRMGIEICRRHDISAIIATGPPFTGQWIGARVSRKTGIPLILDYRDPWTRAPFYPERPGWAAGLDESLERRCLAAASGVVTAVRGIADDLADNFPEVDRSRIEVITNGYDPDDFTETGLPLPTTWTLSHTGSIMRSRIPHVFFEVLAEWLARDPDRLNSIRLRFAGWMDPEMDEILARPPFDRIAVKEGYLDHTESVRMLLTSHLLLLLIVEDPLKKMVMPGKLYEYLGAGKPILALASEGEAAELVDRVGGSRVVDPHDPEAIREALDTAYNAYLAGRPPFGEPDPKVVEEYSRKNLTARLAGILDTVTR